MRPDPNNDLKLVNLTLLSEEEIQTLAKLEITAWQEIKGGSFRESVEAWKSERNDRILGLCFLLEDCPVGMTLFKQHPLSPSWASANAATIHGLKIKKSMQRRGLGHRAFELAIQQLKKEWPAITKLMLSVDADNTAALSIYRAFGMIDSGPMYEGSNAPEHRFEVSLLS